MKSQVPPDYYHDEFVFEREKSLLFTSSWQFVGFKFQLAEHNDFVTRDIGGQSVVVQNFKGELKSFQNVCSHRFSQIQTACSGNRPLQCPYHGWAYDSEGIPTGIPHRPRFDNIDRKCLEELRLREWELETCGDLVFVRETSDDNLSLEQYLGDAYSTVRSISTSLGPQIDCNQMTIAANWKVLVENTLESYHVDFVHSESFKLLGAKGSDFQFQPPHSSWKTSLDVEVQRKLKKVLPVFASRPLALNGYMHQLVFPNLTIATTNGTSFSLQLFDPITPSTTAFTSWVFQTKLDEALSDAKTHILNAVNATVVDFNRRVFAEDKEVCEYVQKGTEQSRQQGMLSDEELRVASFQEAYVEKLESVTSSTNRQRENPPGTTQTPVTRKG